jgi:hypothetical protein
VVAALGDVVLGATAKGVPCDGQCLAEQAERDGALDRLAGAVTRFTDWK